MKYLQYTRHIYHWLCAEMASVLGVGLMRRMLFMPIRKVMSEHMLAWERELWFPVQTESSSTRQVLQKLRLLLFERSWQNLFGFVISWSRSGYADEDVLYEVNKSSITFFFKIDFLQNLNLCNKKESTDVVDQLIFLETVITFLVLFLLYTR